MPWPDTRYLEQLREAALARIESAPDEQALEAVRVELLGRKGQVTTLLRQLGQIPDPEARRQAGQHLNQLREELEQRLGSRQQALRRRAVRERLASERIDVTLPGRAVPIGRLHPVTRTLEEMLRIFVGMGFEVVEGPEVELDYYNFQALGIPKDHPARDMQDTFYVTDEVVLRTHTSPMQVRTMLARRPPVRVVVPGKVYRKDADVTHSPVFHQVEGLLVDEGIRMSDLKGMLSAFARSLYGPDRPVRFVPSYFPFTEPSAEMYVQCGICRGAGCRACKGSGWLEILGCGMVHPQVLRNVGYDPQRYTGFAWGMGVERITMLRYGIDDIRLLFENDLRFLRQF
ncbi:phenylalanine--tRNA ligase subunit alpha [Geochorda subterranea]|uniref:Phenylalanine--tRNA ligase alpha subunit n=1 Tax=Geochorda subterranea TaxID=3109564 RepID=A0ABZ1BS99_9FIRM|nr:phenylalanine--tRNA ligase subunit alpha [Limnochorda sp. LNt]WRP15677.1 phenylalanine--tRNA ligase subunit alpha [Limnochorda sp. LNt]